MVLGLYNAVSLLIIFTSATIAILLRDRSVVAWVQLVIYAGMLSGVLLMVGSAFLCYEEDEHGGADGGDGGDGGDG